MITSRLYASKKFMGALLLTMGFVLPANAQFLRISYLMEGIHYHMQLNPVLAPTSGYFNILVIGSLNVSASSNSLGTQDIIDTIDNSDGFHNNQKFMNRLSNDNRLNVNVNTNILLSGWYKGKNFWSANVGACVDLGARIPKSMFSFLHDTDQDGFSWNNSKFDVGKEELNINAYTEVGIGYARAINDRLSVGGKFKVLLGMGNSNLKADGMNVDANLSPDINDTTDVNQIRDYHAKIEVNARLENPFREMDLVEDTSDPDPWKHYIDDFDFNGLGIAGYGGTIDLGASYKILDNLAVSTFALDLGFIKWSKGSTSVAAAKGSMDYDGKDYALTPEGLEDFQRDAQDFMNRIEDGDVLNYEMLQLQKEDVVESRTTSFHSTVVIGAKYELLDKWLAIGVLSTTCFVKPKTQAETTFSANIRPKSWLSTAISYSMIQSAGKSFGLTVKLGPLFIGTDYMFFGKSTKIVSGFVGISVPSGGKKSSKEE